MEQDQLRERVLATLKEVAPDAETGSLDPERSFHDQLDIDSVDFLNLMLAFENALGVRIAEVDYPKLSNLKGCLAYLAPRVTDTERARAG